MDDTEPQTAAAKVLWHFTMSLDGFVAGPEHDMQWLTGVAIRPGLIEEYTRTTGAVLAGRDGFDSAIGDARPYGGAWQGPIFVLTHHPEDARPADDGIIRLHRVGDGDPASTVNVRYRPVTTGRSAAGSPGAAQALDREGIPC